MTSCSEKEEVNYTLWTLSKILIENFDEKFSAGKNGLGKLWFYYEGWNFNSGNYLFTTDTK